MTAPGRHDGALIIACGVVATGLIEVLSRATESYDPEMPWLIALRISPTAEKPVGDYDDYVITFPKGNKGHLYKEEAVEAERAFINGAHDQLNVAGNSSRSVMVVTFGLPEHLCSYVSAALVDFYEMELRGGFGHSL